MTDTTSDADVGSTLSRNAKKTLFLVVLDLKSCFPAISREHLLSLAAAALPYVDLRWTRLTRDQVTAIVDKLLQPPARLQEMYICRQDLIQERNFIGLNGQSNSCYC